MVNKNPKIKVVICDDSPFMRRVVSEILNSEPDIEILKSYGSGEEMLFDLKRMKPGVILLDYHMPKMNGIEVLKRIMKTQPTPTIMLTGHIEEGTEEALQAYEAGAVAIVSKPGGSYSLSLKEVQQELITEIRNASTVRPEKIKKFIDETVVSILKRPKAKFSFPALVIGASTGGPAVLERLIPSLPADFNGTVLVAQHMPEHLTGMMARRLREISKINVKEAEDGEIIHSGMTYIAPGKHHLLIQVNNKGEPVIYLRDEELFIGPAPSIDMLFESAAHVFGDKTIGSILTGTGRDGLVGSKVIKELSGRVFVQDAASSLVFGMGKEVVDKGLADAIISPEEIAKRVTEAFK